jgi:hypothetical protein
MKVMMRTTTTGHQLLSLIAVLLISTVLAFVPPLAYDTKCRNLLNAESSAATPFSIGGASDELLELFNKQVTQEMAASQFYLSAKIGKGKQSICWQNLQKKEDMLFN